MGRAQRYNYQLCNEYLEKRDLNRLWMHIQHEGDKILPDAVLRLSIFYKAAKKWLSDTRLTGNFVAFYLKTLQLKACSQGITAAGMTMEGRTAYLRAENQKWNPAEDYEPKTMQEELLLRFA